MQKIKNFIDIMGYRPIDRGCTNGGG